jgi:hypothetical protein
LCYDESQKTKDAAKEKEERMQTVTGRNTGRLSPQSRRIAIFAVLLFGLSGLISGFAMGAFIRPKIPGITTSGGNGLTPPVSQSTTVTTTQVRPIPIGYPVISHITLTETADNTSIYTVSAYAVDQSIDAGHGKPVHAAGISCKLWIEHIPGSRVVDLPGEKLMAMSLQQPLTSEEIPNGLNFTTTAAQIEQTNSDGQVKWTYTVATNVDPGQYYMVVLMDWQGKHYNWSWVELQITGARH